jgi:hypothetical protein
VGPNVLPDDAYQWQQDRYECHLALYQAQTQGVLPLAARRQP